MLSVLLRRIFLSTLGNLIGRVFNVLLPFIIVWRFGINSETDIVFFYLAAAYYCSNTLANAYADSLVSTIGRSLNRPGDLTENLLILILSFAPAIFIVVAKYETGTYIDLVLVFLIGYLGLVCAKESAFLLIQHRHGIVGLTWLYRVIPLVSIQFLGQTESLLSVVLLSLMVADFFRYLTLLLIVRKYKQSLAVISSNYGLTLSLMGAALIAGFNPIIDRYIATWGNEGSLSIIESAERVFGIVGMVVSVGVATVTLVEFAKIREDRLFFQHWKKSSLLATLMGFAGILLGLIVWEVIQWIDLLEKVDSQSVTEIEKCLFVYLATLPLFMLGMISVRALISRQRKIYLLWAAFAGALVNLISSATLQPLFGTVGIVMGTFIMYVVTTILVVFKVIWLFGAGNRNKSTISELPE